MKPITKGRGENNFSLYFPFSVLDGVEPLDIESLILQLSHHFSTRIEIKAVERKDLDILKLSIFSSYEKAVEAFNELKRIFLYLSIESDIAIYFEDSLIELMEPFGHFLKSWEDGVRAGWEADKKEGLILIDGVAHILNPIIVSEQKKLLIQGPFWVG
ncbi:MAG: hypothetical protein HUN05_19735 [Desulfobacter sp.]|nr:MAG: hypothetical protein HUN05_19735 [Desulfobacter sp.]